MSARYKVTEVSLAKLIPEPYQRIADYCKDLCNHSYRISDWDAIVDTIEGWVSLRRMEKPGRKISFSYIEKDNAFYLSNNCDLSRVFVRVNFEKLEVEEG